MRSFALKKPPVRLFRVWQRVGGIKIYHRVRSSLVIKSTLFLPADRGKHLSSQIPFVYKISFCSLGRKLRIFYFTINRMDGCVQFLPDELVDKAVAMGDFSIEDVSNLRLTSKHCNAAIESGCDSFYNNKPWLCVAFDQDCLLAFNPLSHKWVSIPRECFSMPEDCTRNFMFPNGLGRSILYNGFHNKLLLSQVDNWVESSFSWKEIPCPTQPNPFNGEFFYPMFCVGDVDGETKVVAISRKNSHSNDEEEPSGQLLDVFNASRWEWEVIHHYIHPGPRGENSRIETKNSSCLVYQGKLYALRQFNRGEFVCIDMEDKAVEGEFSTVKPQRKFDNQRFWLVHGGRHGLLLAGIVCPLQGEQVIQGRDIKKQMSFRVWKLIVKGVPTEGRDVECVEIARMPYQMFKDMKGDKGAYLGCVGLKDLIYVYAPNEGQSCSVELISKADGPVSSVWRVLPSHQHLVYTEGHFGYKAYGCLNLNAYNIKCMMNCSHPTQL